MVIEVDHLAAAGELDDGEFERRLSPGEVQPQWPAPHWAKLREELQRRSVTLVLL
jgi:hypothetical protein